MWAAVADKHGLFAGTLGQLLIFLLALSGMLGLFWLVVAPDRWGGRRRVRHRRYEFDRRGRIVEPPVTVGPYGFTDEAPFWPLFCPEPGCRHIEDGVGAGPRLDVHIRQWHPWLVPKPPAVV